MTTPNASWPSLTIENLSYKFYTHSIQLSFISMIGWLFQVHEHTDLPFLTKLLEGRLHHCLLPNGPTMALGFKWRPYPPPNPMANSATSKSKWQFTKAVHVEVAKEYKGIAATWNAKLSTALPSNAQLTWLWSWCHCTPIASLWCSKIYFGAPSPNMPNAWQCLNTL